MKADVSVIVCVRNAGKYIESCLLSLLNQTFSDLEVLIIEDGRDAQRARQEHAGLLETSFARMKRNHLI